MQYRYRLLIEFEDGTYKVMEDEKDNLLDYRPQDGETVYLIREQRYEV